MGFSGLDGGGEGGSGREVKIAQYHDFRTFWKGLDH